jgi:glyoxylase-like metal-dependent hydrolase (beta-lactamase superfamily II)
MRKEFEKRQTFSQKEIDFWFDYAKPEETENGVIWFNEPHHFEDVYFYLIKGAQRDLLIDTGMGIAPIAPLLSSVRDTSKELIVANTHWHFDHIGGNREFEKVYIPSNGAEVEGIRNGWTKEEMSKYFFFDGFWHGNPTYFQKDTFSIPGYAKNAPLPDSIDMGDRVIRTIYTPGHTPGSVSFFDETNGLLFTGDLLYEGPLYAFEDESSPEHYLESLKKIAKLPIKIIHPGHNHASTKDFPFLINEAIALFERAMNKDQWDADGEFPGTAEYHHSDSAKGRRLKVIV